MNPVARIEPACVVVSQLRQPRRRSGDTMLGSHEAPFSMTSPAGVTPDEERGFSPKCFEFDNFFRKNQENANFFSSMGDGFASR